MNDSGVMCESGRYVSLIKLLVDRAPILFFLLLTLNLAAQQIQVEWQVDVRPEQGGWYPWYEVHADPSNAANLIMCGGIGNGQRNTLHGFVYSSWDGGKTWYPTLEDKNSAWVSEQSCAYGLKGRAYFVSEATKIADGVKHTDSGTTRIFVSDNAGHTWHERTTTEWADYSYSAVDVHIGQKQNRLYTFFNSSDGHDGARVGLFSLGTHDSRIRRPLSDAEPGSEGAFPEKGVVLKDGSVLVLYWGGQKSKDAQEVFLAAVRMSPEGKSQTTPVIITHSPVDTEVDCYGYAEAYNSATDEMLAAYHHLSAGVCGFMLTSSLDGGATWSIPVEIKTQDGIAHRFETPAMAVNRDGILGLMWREQRDSDCWYFSATSGSALKFSAPSRLSQCQIASSAGPVISTPFLVSEIAGTNIRVANMRGEIWRNSGSLTAAIDGTFHAVWPESGQGRGQLRTARLKMGGSDESRLLPRLSTGHMKEVSGRVTLLFGGKQHFDPSSGTLQLDITLRNKSGTRIKGPVFLRVRTLTGELGKVEVTNSSNGISGPGAVWDLSSAIPHGVLPPGATSRPYVLLFRIIPESLASAPKVEAINMKLDTFSE